MRIISGQYRGRRLLAPPGRATRPMTDRVKESLFATIADWLDGAAVADLFCGTGSAGLEALSRGAAHVWFADRDREALRRLRRNIAMLDAGDRTTIWTGDLRRRLTRRLAELERPLDVVLLDPPYAMARQWFAEQADRARIERVLFEPIAGALAADGIVVLRTPADLEAPVRLAALERRRHRTCGSMALTYYQPVGDAAGESSPYNSPEQRRNRS